MKDAVELRFAVFAFVLLRLTTGCRSPSTTTSPAESASAPKIAPSSAAPVALKTPKLHRASVATCDVPRPAGSVIAPPPLDPTYLAEIAKPDHHDCLADSDCKNGKNGRCLIEAQMFRGTKVGTFARCSYDACVNDADCGNGNACMCREAFGGRRENVCVDARCATDADCGKGGACSPTLAISEQACRSEGLPFAALRCHTSKDECIDDADCTGGVCAYSESKSRWVCDARVCLPD